MRSAPDRRARSSAILGTLLNDGGICVWLTVTAVMTAADGLVLLRLGRPQRLDSPALRGRAPVALRRGRHCRQRGQTPDQSQPWAELGLKDGEYARIKEILGRRPTSSELAMYSVMWSEHCSYKSSKVHLRQFA